MKIKNIIITISSSVLILILTLLLFFAPKHAYSDSERRTLSQFPDISIESIKNGKFMNDFEKFCNDQFFLRDKFRTSKALFSKYILRQKDNNGIYIYNNIAAAVEYPFDKDSAEYAANKFAQIYSKYLNENNKVVFSIIPDKNYYLADESGHLKINPADFAQVISAKNPSFSYVDITALLDISDYYKTDTHWRMEKISDIAKTIVCEFSKEIIENTKENTLDKDFYGVYYGQCALPLKAEKIKYLTSPTLDNCTVFNYQDNKDETIYNMGKAHGKDSYEMFLSGPISLIEINNPNKKDGHLIIFRDSFGSAIAPYFVEDYAKITLVDIRYLQSAMLGQFINFENADVLFLDSTLILNNSNTLK